MFLDNKLDFDNEKIIQSSKKMEKDDKKELNEQLKSDNSIKHKVKLKGHTQSVLCLDLDQEKHILASGGEVNLKFLSI